MIRSRVARELECQRNEVRADFSQLPMIVGAVVKRQDDAEYLLPVRLSRFVSNLIETKQTRPLIDSIDRNYQN